MATVAVRLAVGLARCGRAGAARSGVASVPRARELAAAAAAAPASAAALRETVLHGLHEAAGGKMVDFAGWSMPVLYKGQTISESVAQVRERAGLFDVSHMCGITLSGTDAERFVEKIVVGDISGLTEGTGTLSVMLDEAGGIIDDTVVTRVGKGEIYMVLNAGCAEKDLEHIGAQLSDFSGDVSLKVHDNRSLLALQGPKAAEVLQTLTSEDLSQLYFGMLRTVEVNGADCWVMRTGYTGEDGFEISVPNDAAPALAETLTAHANVEWAGLGARDTLRLEAGLCLYGNDIDLSTSPLEAGLKWTIGKARQEKLDFIGGEAVRNLMAEGITRRRVGFVVGKGAPARQHSPILSEDGKTIGEITSGGFSPTLGANISMGYVEKAFGKAGTEVKVEVRGRTNSAIVTKMPFITPTYYRPS